MLTYRVPKGTPVTNTIIPAIGMAGYPYKMPTASLSPNLYTEKTKHCNSYTEKKNKIKYATLLFCVL